MNIKFLLIIILSIIVTGCAHANSRGLSFQEGATGRLFVWNSEYSAAVGHDNKMCVQGARTAKARSGSLAADVVAELQVGGSYGEKVVVLNPGNAQSTFANGGFFAICQIALNNPDFPDELVAEMFKEVALATPKVGLTHAGKTTLDSPEIVNVVKDVLQRNGVTTSDTTLTTQVEDAVEKLNK